MAIACHCFNESDTWEDLSDEISAGCDGSLTLAKDLLVWNLTGEGIIAKEVSAQESV